VVQKMSERKAKGMEMRPLGGHRLCLVFYAPTRLIGYLGGLLTDTRGASSAFASVFDRSRARPSDFTGAFLTPNLGSSRSRRQAGSNAGSWKVHRPILSGSLIS